MILGATLVVEITPKAGSGLKPTSPLVMFGGQSRPTTQTDPASRFGFENEGVLKALKNSARNSRFLVSPCANGIFLVIEISKSCWAGPPTLPMPPLPKPVARPSAPITGGAVKQALLK